LLSKFASNKPAGVNKSNPRKPFSDTNIQKPFSNNKIMDEKIIEQQRITLIKRIKQMRIRKGISTYGMADLIDMREPNYVRAESGRQSIGIDLFLKIANALGLEIELIDKGQAGV
jgi:DNA-binding XRE family transcriptional regulator